MSTTQLSAEELDEARKRRQAYEYLCHLEEIRLWLEMVLKKDMGLSSDLESKLRNGVDVALLASIIDPEKCPRHKIYDVELKRYNDIGLHFKYTDNIMMLFRACESVGLPKVFLPETLDLYDAKNTPKVIFCLHALAHRCAMKGILPTIPDLCGKAEFGEQEITKIQKLLEKSGVKMPAFGKIGGILADQLTEDDAATHAAVILISEALDMQDLDLFMQRLKSPLLKLLRVRDYHAQEYYDTMGERKAEKVKLYEKRNKEDKEGDVYDKVLSLSQIQDCITNVNVNALLAKISKAVEENDKASLSECILSDEFQHFRVRTALGPKYADYAQKYIEQLNKSGKPLTAGDIREIVTHVNQEDDRIKEIETFVKTVSEALEQKDIPALQAAVKCPPKGHCPIDSDNGNLIYANLQQLIKENGGLNDRSIDSALRCTALVCAINRDVEKEDQDSLYQHLSDNILGVSGVNSNLSLKYIRSLADAREAKSQQQALEGSDLLYKEIVGCVDEVNQFVIDEMGKYEVVTKINENLNTMTIDELLELLMNSNGKFVNVVEKNRDLYYQTLLHKKKTAEAIGGEGSHAFFHDQIQETIDEVNALVVKLHERQDHIDDINRVLLNGEKGKLYPALVESGIKGLIPECDEKYFSALTEKIQSRDIQSWDGWMEHKFYLKGDVSVYYNRNDNQYRLRDPPPGFTPIVGYLNIQDIQDVCNHVGSDYNRELYYKQNVESIVNLQSMYRTHVLYDKYHSYRKLVFVELPNLIILQNHYKTYTVLRDFRERLRYIMEHQSDALVLKNFAKAFCKVRHKDTKRGLYISHLSSIVGLQSFLRTYTAQNDYCNLIHETCPTLRRVYKYIHLLEPDDADILQEQELWRCRNTVYDKIRDTESLEADVRNQYHLIGVIVNNRKTLSALENAHSRLRRTRFKDMPVITISKERIELREKYGQLFYLLQRKPEYISRLMFKLNLDSQHSKFIKDFFLNLFSYGATSRDEYFMMKALEACIEYEIESNIDSIQEFSKSDPSTFKISVRYYREVKAPKFLQVILSDPINKILDIKNVLNFNPPDVYKIWVSKVETETGEKSNLPLEVSVEEALSHEAVSEQIRKDVAIIIELATSLRDSILDKCEYIPFGIRYIAKTIYDSLSNKFSAASDIDKLKVVALLLYYRFINPATIDPIGFSVIKNKTELKQEQRRNLGTVSRIIQNASVYSMPETTLEILKPLDDFSRESAEKFMAFFRRCINVPSLEEFYNINQYTDHTQVRLPELRITLNQMVEMNKILIDNKDCLFLTDDDILLKVLGDIGEVPTLESLADTRVTTNQGKSDKGGAHAGKKGDKGAAPVSESLEETVGNSPTLLPLIPPKELLETEENKNAQLLDDSINKLVDLLKFVRCDTIPQVLGYNFNEEQENSYKRLLNKRRSMIGKTDAALVESGGAEIAQTAAAVTAEFMSLAEVQNEVKEKLKVLEEAGVVKPDNDYQMLVVKIINKILLRRRFIKAGRVEIAKLKSTIEDLNNKHEDLTKQLECYNMYIKECIANMTQRKKYKKEQVSRSAYKLMQDGIITSIDGITDEQTKTVTVTISTTDTPGVFKVVGKFIGIKVGDKEDCFLSYQDLLQYQYNNQPVIKLMGLVTVKVSLLIYFINKHFLS